MYGAWQQLGASFDWKSTTAGVALDGALYLSAGGDLYRVSPGDGAYEAVGDGGWDTRLLAAVGASLYAVENNGTLYRIDPVGGAYEQLEGDWRYAGAAVGHAGRLYIADGDSLWEVDPITGAFAALETGTTWSKTHLLASVGNVLVTCDESGSLCRVPPAAPAQWAQLGGNWQRTQAMVGHRGRLYAQDSGAWYVVHPVEDIYEELPAGGSWDTRLALSMDDSLYAVEIAGTLYRLTIQPGDQPSSEP